MSITQPTGGRPPVDTAQAVATLAEMVRFDTRTETAGESSVCPWLVDRLTAIGLDARLVPVTGNPDRVNVVATWKGTGGAGSLMFNGHVDTNPLTDGWTVDPWGGHVDEEFIYGLGVSNMKAGCAAYLEAVRTLAAAGWRPAGDVILTFVVGELQNGVGTRSVLEAGYRADHFVNCEPTDLTAVTTHAGAATFRVRLSGSTRHMSKREDAGDAAAAAAALLPVINRMTFQGAVDEAAATTNRAHVGVVRSGLGPDLLDTRPPQVADVAELLGSVRFGPGQDATGALAELARAVDEVCAPAGVTGRVERIGDGGPSMDRPFRTPDGAAVARALHTAYETLRRTPQPAGAIRPYCYYGSDASLLQHAGGMTGVVCGPGGAYNTMPDERVSLVDYLDAVRLYADVVDRMCGPR